MDIGEPLRSLGGWPADAEAATHLLRSVEHEHGHELVSSHAPSQSIALAFPWSEKRLEDRVPSWKAQLEVAGAGANLVGSCCGVLIGECAH